MKDIKVLGIPFDFGQDHIGVRLAPHVLRESNLISRLQEIAPTIDREDIIFPFKLKESKQEGAIKHSLAASLGTKSISDQIERENLDESFLLNIGGDHGLSLGTIHGLLAHRPETIVVWADAHGDINTPEVSPSGNFHGMPLAFLLGLAKHPHFSWIRRKLLPEKLIFFGPRDLDQGEKDIIEQHSIQYFSSEDVNRLGAKEVLEMALHKADPFATCPIHLSFDVDVFDQFDIHSTGTKVPHGPKLEELFLMGGILAETGRLKSMDLVELNPQIGNAPSVERSIALVLEFLESTLKQVFAEHHNLKKLPTMLGARTTSGRYL